MSNHSRGREPVLKAFRPANSARAKAKAQALMADKSKTVRVNFDLDLDTHCRLKVRAAQVGLTVAALLRRAIEDMLYDVAREP